MALLGRKRQHPRCQALWRAGVLPHDLTGCLQNTGRGYPIFRKGNCSASQVIHCKKAEQGWDPECPQLPTVLRHGLPSSWAVDVGKPKEAPNLSRILLQNPWIKDFFFPVSSVKSVLPRSLNMCLLRKGPHGESCLDHSRNIHKAPNMCQTFVDQGTRKIAEVKQTEWQPSSSLHFGLALDWQEQDNLLGTPLLYTMCQETPQPTWCQALLEGPAARPGISEDYPYLSSWTVNTDTALFFLIRMLSTMNNNYKSMIKIKYKIIFRPKQIFRKAI